MYQDPLYTTKCSSVTLQSESKGFFQQFADYMTTKVGVIWLEDFGKLANNKQRIEKCYFDENVCDELRDVLSNVQEMYRNKSERMSATKKAEADEWLKKGKFDRSLLLYNQSVVRAPTQSDPDKPGDDGFGLAPVLWGRSECLFKLERYRLCLIDVRLCLKEKLPARLKLNAYGRMAECYEKLNEFKKLRICLNVIDKLVDESSSELSDVTTEEWKDKVQNKRNLIERESALTTNCGGGGGAQIQEDNNNNDSSAAIIPMVTNGVNERLKGASKLLKLSQSNAEGRYVIAAGPIKAADTLVVEDAYVSCLLADKFGTHCQHCFSRLYSVVPCHGCSGVAFCSEECKTVATGTYHKYECRYMDMMIGSGMSILCFLALRIVTQNEAQYFLNNNEIDIESGRRDIAKVDPKHRYTYIYNMECHQNKRKAWDFFHRTLMALFLLTILKKSGYFNGVDDSLRSDKLSLPELFVGSVLLRNLEVLQFNAHEIYETVTTKNPPIKSKMINIGAGLYKTASLFNHDCYAALVRYFVGTKLVMKALRPINTGEMVPENYGSSFTTQTLAQRQRILCSRYWFECRCRACNEDWPTLDRLLDSSVNIRCIACQKGITTIRNDEPTECCLNCGKEINVGRINKITDKLNKTFQNAIRKIENFQHVEAVDLLLSFSENAHKLYEKPTKNLCLSHEKLRMCWSLNGNVYQV